MWASTPSPRHLAAANSPRAKGKINFPATESTGTEAEADFSGEQNDTLTEVQIGEYKGGGQLTMGEGIKVDGF